MLPTGELACDECEGLRGDGGREPRRDLAPGNIRVASNRATFESSSAELNTELVASAVAEDVEGVRKDMAPSRGRRPRNRASFKLRSEIHCEARYCPRQIMGFTNTDRPSCS